MYDIILGAVSAVMLAGYAAYHRFGLKGSKIQFSLYVYMAMFPFNLALLPLPGTQYADPLLKALLLVGFALSLQRIARRGKVRVNLYEIGMLLVVVITGLLNGAALDTRGALFFPGLINLAFQLLLSFHLLNSIREPRHFRQIAVPVVVNSVVLSLLAIYERFVLGIVRPEATLSNPNYFGLYVLLGFICFLFINHKRRTLWGLLYQALAVGAILLSGSNAVLAALLVALLVRFIGASRSHVVDALLVTAMIGVAVFFLAVTVGTGDAPFGLLRYFVKQDDLSRAYVWRVAWDTFLGHPWAGIGYGTFRAPYSGLAYVTHNDYLRILAELGLAGSAVFVAYVVSLIRRAVACRAHDVRVFVLSVVLAILLFSLTHNNMNAITFWFFLSLPYYVDVLAVGSGPTEKGGGVGDVAWDKATRE